MDRTVAVLIKKMQNAEFNGIRKLFLILFSFNFICLSIYCFSFLFQIRNTSYCDEMSIELRVFGKTEVSLPVISYPQILTFSTSGSLVCPELSEFTRNKTDMKIQWYKVHLKKLAVNKMCFTTHRNDTKCLF